NLTGGGLWRNVEIWSGSDVESLLAALDERRGELTQVSRDEFGAWVGALPAVEPIRERVAHELERASDAVPTLEVAEAGVPLAAFVEWCSWQEPANGAAGRIVDFATNRTEEQVQGHVKQAYYAAQLFLDVAPEHVEELLAAPDDQPFQLQDSP